MALHGSLALWLLGVRGRLRLVGQPARGLGPPEVRGALGAGAKLHAGYEAHAPLLQLSLKPVEVAADGHEVVHLLHADALETVQALLDLRAADATGLFQEG